MSRKIFINFNRLSPAQALLAGICLYPRGPEIDVTHRQTGRVGSAIRENPSLFILLRCAIIKIKMKFVRPDCWVLLSYNFLQPVREGGCYEDHRERHKG